MTIQHAMVLAAGLGARMRPITNTLPKPLVKIAGKPLIDYALDALKQAGVRKAVVNVHYLADLMEAHLAAYQDLDILISDEREKLMNSGGGLVKGLRLLGDGPVFVMNADLFWVGEKTGDDSNLNRLARFFNPETMDMALLCAPVDRTTGHNGGSDFSLAENGTLTRYQPNHGQGVVYAGAIALHTSLFANAPDDAFNLNIYFDRAIAQSRLCGLVLDGDWVTAGTPEAIPAAEAVVRGHASGAANV